MGGKALLPQVPTLKRLPKKEYDILAREAVQAMCNALGMYSQDLQIIPAYGRKEDFGDCDIIVKEETLAKRPGWRDIIRTKLGSKAVHETENSNVFSFEYKDFQFDIIRVPTKHYNFAYHYFSFNDLGNLIGRIAHAMGFKFGHEGLKMVVMEGTQKLEEIVVTTNFFEALDLLGFPGNSYTYYFATLEEIFNYVVNSKYFSKEPFLMENRNHRDRVRDAKRTTYMSFLDHIDKPEVISKFDFTAGKAPWASVIKKSYPQVVTRYNRIRKERETLKLIKEKFNGEIVGAITGFSGPALGKFISEYKEKFKGINEFEVFIMSSQPNTITEDIKSFAVGWSEKKPEIALPSTEPPKYMFEPGFIAPIAPQPHGFAIGSTLFNNGVAIGTILSMDPASGTATVVSASNPGTVVNIITADLQNS